MNVNERKGALPLIVGKFGPEDFDVSLTEGRLSFSPELQAKIDADWAPKAAKGYFPGPLARLDSLVLSPDGKIFLGLGDTDFKEYSGARDIKSLETYGYYGIPNPLSVSAVVVTSDGKLIISQKRQGDAVGAIDAVGGYITPLKDIDPQGKTDLFRAVIREVGEEVVFGKSKLDEAELLTAQKLITGLYCLGFCYEYAGQEELCHPVASFVVEMAMTSEEFLEVKPDEVTAIVVDPNDALSLLEASPLVEPDGAFTISMALLYLKNQLPQAAQSYTLDQV